MPYLDRTGWSVSVSSSYDGAPENAAANMLDGDDATAWTSGNGYPHSIVLNLGSDQTFDTVVFTPKPYFDSQIPSTVEVYVSSDGINWGSVLATATWPKAGGGTQEFIMLPRQTIQYVKLLGTASASGYWACSELNLWIEQGLNRFAWTASATSHYDAATDASAAIDGYGLQNYSNWISDVGMPQSITVDMGSLQTINYIRVDHANVRFYDPIFFGQALPKRVKAYVSVDGSIWSMVQEMVWPEYGDTHWIRFENNLAGVSVRYFRFEATDCDGWYDRLAISEIYAGLLVSGEIYKHYLKARPQTLEDLSPLLDPTSANGVVDYLTASPEIEAKIRIWKTRGLAYYSEVCCSGWSLPSDWMTLTLESVSAVVEGQHLNSSTVFTQAWFAFLDHRDSAQFTFGFFTPWSNVGGDIAPQVQSLMYRDDTGWGTDGSGNTLSKALVQTLFSNLLIFNSVSQDAVSHDDADVSRLLVDDHYLLVVWNEPYVPPALALACANPPDGTVGVAYSHQMTLTGGTAPYTVSITDGSLPDGLSIDDAALITGTPTVAGTFTYTATVFDSDQNQTDVECSITILAVPGTLALDCASPPLGTVGIVYSHQMLITGGTPPYTVVLS